MAACVKHNRLQTKIKREKIWMEIRRCQIVCVSHDMVTHCMHMSSGVFLR